MPPCALIVMTSAFMSAESALQICPGLPGCTMMLSKGLADAEKCQLSQWPSRYMTSCTLKRIAAGKVEHVVTTNWPWTSYSSSFPSVSLDTRPRCYVWGAPNCGAKWRNSARRRTTRLPRFFRRTKHTARTVPSRGYAYLGLACCVRQPDNLTV